MIIENWLNERKRSPLTKYIIFFVASALLFFGINFGIRWLDNSKIAQYERKDTDFYTLPAAPCVLVSPEEKIAIKDTSTYAREEGLALNRYTDYYYDEDLLIAEADYDKTGRLLGQSGWEYDTAGNLIRERTKDEAGEQTRSYLYEYDNAGNVVHQKIYWGEAVVEDNYYRDTDIGCAGISFSYFNDQIEGGISQYCSERTEFLEDKEGRLLCMFHLNALETERPKDACKIQWAQQGEYLVSRVRYYEDDVWTSSREDWYQTTTAADAEQCNIYERDSGNLVLQINFVWNEDMLVYDRAPSFYLARYEEGRLLWQMDYIEGVLSHYSVCQYDADGRLSEGVEYEMQEDGAGAVFHRFAYPQKERTEKYSYDVLGREFIQPFGNGEKACLTFSETGILTGIEITDTSGNVSEKYEFNPSGESAGGLVDQRSFLKKLEMEAAGYGFHVWEDLEGSVE